MLLGSHKLIGDVEPNVDFATARCVVPERDQPAAVVVASQVQHDGAKIGRRPIDRLDAAGVPGESKERLLHKVFCRVAIVDEEPRQPHQASAPPFGTDGQRAPPPRR